MRPDADSTTVDLVAALLAPLIPASLRPVFRYGCVGLAISLLYSLAVIACVQLLDPISPTVASVIAFIITLPAAYLAHGRASFSDRPYDGFQPLRFALSTTTSFIVAFGGMYWITVIAGRSYLLGIAWNWPVIPALYLLTNMFRLFRAVRSTGRTA